MCVLDGGGDAIDGGGDAEPEPISKYDPEFPTHPNSLVFNTHDVPLKLKALQVPSREHALQHSSCEEKVNGDLILSDADSPHVPLLTTGQVDGDGGGSVFGAGGGDDAESS